MSASEPTATSNKHLIVLVHGYLGSAFGMRELAATLQAYDRHAVVHIATFPDAKQWSLFTTTDGIEKGGERLAAEIQAIVATHRGALDRISLVGVSLGGVFCRWVAHRLANFETATIAGLKPYVYVSVASPHIGVAHSLGSVYQSTMSGLTYAGERTGAQLLGLDDYQCLQQLAEPTYLAAWNLFERRYLFANMLNDNRVDYCSAAILQSPQHDLQDADALRDTSREVVGSYDVADYLGGQFHPPYETAAALDQKQLALLNKIRSELRFVNVDLRLDLNWFSRLFAHVVPLGLFVNWGAQGRESVQSIARAVIP